MTIVGIVFVFRFDWVGKYGCVWLFWGSSLNFRCMMLEEGV